MIRRLATTVLLLAMATSMLLAAEKAKKPQGGFTTLADFQGSSNGASPIVSGNLIQGTDKPYGERHIEGKRRIPSRARNSVDIPLRRGSDQHLA